MLQDERGVAPMNAGAVGGQYDDHCDFPIEFFDQVRRLSPAANRAVAVALVVGPTEELERVEEPIGVGCQRLPIDRGRSGGLGCEKRGGQK